MASTVAALALLIVVVAATFDDDLLAKKRDLRSRLESKLEDAGAVDRRSTLSEKLEALKQRFPGQYRQGKRWLIPESKRKNLNCYFTPVQCILERRRR